MKFEFDTTNDGAKEAAALVTALAILHGEGVLEAIDKASDKLEAGESKLASDGHPAGRKSEHFMDDAAHIEVAPTPPAPTGAVDTNGLPWDELIHASTKTTNKDGTWSRRRNTPDDVFDKRMAELIAARDGAKEAAPTEASAQEAFAEETPASPPAPAEVPAPPAAETVVPQPPAPAGTTVSFPQLMVKITKAQTAGKIDKATVDGFLATFGLDKIAGLASAGVDTIAAVNAMVDEHVNGGQ